MIPPLLSQMSIKNVLSIRAVCSVVMDKIVYEALDSSTITHAFTCPTPTDILYIVFAGYFIKLYLSEYSAIRTKQIELHQYVLTPGVYRTLNLCLFMIFLLVKNPENVL